MLTGASIHSARNASAGRLVVLLLLYGLSFAILRHSASAWSTLGLFSLWFPAAGLRFAFLWWQGARITPWAALAELVAQFVDRPERFADDPLLVVIGVIGPCLMYGAVIGIAQHLAARRQKVDADPLPFALAAVAGPVLACVAALPWALPLAMKDGALSPHELGSALLVFAMGDMLGILIVAPPLLWLLDPRTRASQRWVRSIPLARWIEVSAMLAGAFLLILAIRSLGFHALRGPILLACWWAALRTGRLGAWLSSLLTCLFLLPQSLAVSSAEARLALHMILVTNAAGAFVIGAYAEAQDALRREVARRDRLLRRAERLKNLRAMSVAVIHEVSQPLSTLSLEADHLIEQIDRGDNPTALKATAALLARKADDLSTLVRRLRQFGGESDEQHSPLALRLLVEDAVQLAIAEAGCGKDAVRVVPGPETMVRGSDVELRQSLLNLFRNALRASRCEAGGVTAGWSVAEGRVHIDVDNAVLAPGGRGGLGIGLVIARSIADAHGGSISLDASAPSRMRARMTLPVVQGQPHE